MSTNTCPQTLCPRATSCLHSLLSGFRLDVPLPDGKFAACTAVNGYPDYVECGRVRESEPVRREPK